MKILAFALMAAIIYAQSPLSFSSCSTCIASSQNGWCADAGKCYSVADAIKVNTDTGRASCALITLRRNNCYHSRCSATAINLLRLRSLNVL